MTTESLLEIYDREQRRDVIYPGTIREEAPHVVRHVDKSGVMGYILYSQLDEQNADRIIQEQIAYFGEQRFEWKFYTHDTPIDLKDRLEKQGFEIEESEAILVLDTEKLTGKLREPITHDVRRITDPDEVLKVMTVQGKVFGANSDDEEDWIAQHVSRELRNTPDFVSIYAAYTADGIVASCAWTRFPEKNSFASLWGAATLPEYRGKGFYTAILATRVQEAIRRGRRYLTVDASPMSRPILEKSGFEWVTTSYPCQWNRKKEK